MNIVPMGARGRTVGAGAFALCVSAALIGWGTSQQAHYERQAEDQAAENARHANYDVRYRCFSLPVLAKRNCSIDQRREERAYERDEQNLYAQKTTAFWTFLIGSAAIIGMVLSAVGVFLVFFTFGETRRANLLNMRENARATRRAIASSKETTVALEAANKSAEAAAGQVEVARETAYRQLRAYISVERVMTSRVDLGSNLIAGWLFIKNAGHTPARINVFIGTNITEFPSVNPIEDGPEPIDMFGHQTFINANSVDKVQWFCPDPPQEGEIMKLAKVVNGGSAFGIYVYGRIEFEDFDRHQRVLHFSYRNNGIAVQGKRIEMIPTPFGNHYEDKGKPA